MKPLYLIASLALVIASCSPQAKLRKALRLIEQAEAAGLQWKSDTVFQEVKIVVPETHIDTVFKAVNFRDTLVITKHNVVTRVKVNTITRDVFVDTKCPEKIVIKKVAHTVTKEISVGDSFWTNAKQWFFWLIIGAGAMWVLVRFRILR